MAVSKRRRSLSAARVRNTKTRLKLRRKTIGKRAKGVTKRTGVRVFRSAYNTAYNAGFDEAYNEGYNSGYAEGLEKGQQEAYKGE
ncbi:hypothetical protein [Paenibacillus gansuensis]|uniref:50S ribosomal protein L20 n=1 Tax=Paenibacillus gansuensis TaxID=306542 RepID=A0ABW5PAR8_9BACL